MTHSEHTAQTELKAPLTRARVVGLASSAFLCLVLVVVLSLLVGSTDVSLKDAWGLLAGTLPEGDVHRLIILRIRLPRALLAALAGSCLSVGGVVFQAVLRNPLADPFILGVSSGAAFGAVLGIVLGVSYAIGAPLMSFSGALLAIFLVMALGARRAGMESTTVLLIGVVVNAFFTAVIMYFVATATDSRLHTMLFWLYGDLSQSRYDQLAFVGPLAALACVLLYGFARHLNVLTAGDETAQMLGMDVSRTKLVCLIVASLGIGLVVAFSGLIGFVGLIVPHLGRLLFGSDHRVLLPISAFGGALFLVTADTLGRTLAFPGEIPVGVVTAFMGAPFFLYLLLRRGTPWNGR